MSAWGCRGDGVSRITINWLGAGTTGPGKELNMKRKTYNNVMRAIKIIQSKGYGFDEASEIALKCFDNME